MSQSRRTERLINLLFVLMSADRPVPKATIRQALEDYASSQSEEAFERMFERDKEELRSMGVPIETVEGTVGAGGIDGYRVRGDEYALPEVSFTAEELSVLALAAQVWEQASLGPAARSALRKLEASGGSARYDGVGVAARLTTPEPSFPAFLAACQARRPVRFDYRKPEDNEPAIRHIQPWGLVSRQGHWYLAGFDKDRSAARIFRLSRVVGPVLTDGPDGSYEAPDPDAARAELIERTTPELTAVLDVAAGEAVSLRRTGQQISAGSHRDRLQVPYRDDETFAEQLVGYGASVVVVEPAALRLAVIRRLSSVVAAAGVA